MSLTFYDMNGEPVAYAERDGSIYLFSGEPVAYIDGDSIYSYSGSHLGWFLDGWIRDHDGDAVMFSSNAVGGPLKPFRQFMPFKAFKEFRPFKGFKELKPLRPLKSFSWSNLSSDEFFAQ